MYTIKDIVKRKLYSLLLGIGETLLNMDVRPINRLGDELIGKALVWYDEYSN